jgi:hypothetical protein
MPGKKKEVECRQSRERCSSVGERERVQGRSMALAREPLLPSSSQASESRVSGVKGHDDRRN